MRNIVATHARNGLYGELVGPMGRSEGCRGVRHRHLPSDLRATTSPRNIRIKTIGDAKAPPRPVVGCMASEDQISIFSTSSIASSTSMPRYLTVLLIME